MFTLSRFFGVDVVSKADPEHEVLLWLFFNFLYIVGVLIPLLHWFTRGSLKLYIYLEQLTYDTIQVAVVVFFEGCRCWTSERRRRTSMATRFPLLGHFARRCCTFLTLYTQSLQPRKRTKDITGENKGDQRKPRSSVGLLTDAVSIACQGIRC